MKISNLKNLSVLIILAWILTGCGESISTTSKSLNEAPKGSVSLQTNLSIINNNGSITLSWSSEAVSDCVASGDWSGNKSPTGSQVISPITSDSSFNLSCSGPEGVVSDSVSVSVVSATSPTVNLSASSLNVAYNGSTQLSWNSTNASSCSASGSWSGTKATSGSSTVYALTADADFILTCSGEDGSASDSVTVMVQPASAPTVSISAASTSVPEGGSTTLSWSSSNTSSCTASGDWSGSKGTSGSQTVTGLTSNSQFVLNCTGAGGSASDSVNVSVLSLPTVNLSSSETSVLQGESTTLSWNTTNATSCSASGDWSGSKGTSGSQTVTGLSANSQFILNCTGAGGSSSDSVNVTVVVSHNGSALLSWTPPTENSDGTTLTDLAGYRIYYGTQSGNYTETIDLPNTQLTSYQIDDLAPASWYFVMTSYNSSNIESAYSPEASKTIN